MEMKVINKSILFSPPPPAPGSPSPTPSPLRSDPDPEDAVVGPPEPAVVLGVGVGPPHNAQQNLDWLIGFCFSSAVVIALQFLQTRVPLPIGLQLLCLAMVCAVAALFTSKYISSKHPNWARVLEHVGVLFGVTAFLFAITPSFSLCLKLISWIIYALSLLAIFISNCS